MSKKLAAKTFEVGDLVWAKMKYSPVWPGEILTSPSVTDEDKGHGHYVLFYSTDNFAWVADKNIYPHSDEVLEKYGQNKRGSLKIAVDTIVEKAAKGENRASSDKLAKSKPLKSPKSKALPKTKKLKIVRKRRPLIKKRKLMTKRPLRKLSASSRESKHYVLSSDESASISDDDLSTGSFTLKIGFIGLGNMGIRIVKNLLQYGYFVTLWNRSMEKCYPLLDLFDGVEFADCPSDVIVASDVTFCCVSDVAAVDAIFHGDSGVLKGFKLCQGLKKGYVEMTTIVTEASSCFESAITEIGGRYLTALLSGSRVEADKGSLVVFTAGDQTVYEDCEECFEVFSNQHMYMGTDLGNALKMRIVHHCVHGTLNVSAAEHIALAHRGDIDSRHFSEVLLLSDFISETTVAKGESLIRKGKEEEDSTQMKHMLDDMRLGLSLSNEANQRMPLLAAAYNVHRRPNFLGYVD